MLHVYLPVCRKASIWDLDPAPPVQLLPPCPTLPSSPLTWPVTKRLASPCEHSTQLHPFCYTTQVLFCHLLADAAASLVLALQACVLPGWGRTGEALASLLLAGVRACVCMRACVA